MKFKKLVLVLSIFNLFTFQNLMADMLDLYMTAILPSIISSQHPTNHVPIADAGLDQTSNSGSTIILDGSSSIDADGDNLTYSWSIVIKPQGSNAKILNSDSVKPSFTADQDGSYTARLIVKDGTVESAPDYVEIIISADNLPPIAYAGRDQGVKTGGTVTLDGSGSIDAEGDMLSYTWLLELAPAGSTATLSDTSQVNPTFIADLEGYYVFSLIVNDGTSDSSFDYVTIKATTPNSAPVADAGIDQSVKTGLTVILDGTGSTDADGDNLAYKWRLTSKPLNSVSILNDELSTHPQFTPDTDGYYVFQLIVKDGTVESTADTVTVTASTPNSTPVANAGPDQNVNTGSSVTLDGTRSSDADGNTLTYIWTLKSKPSGSSVALSNTAVAKPTFTADKDGAYVFQLKVNDSTVDSVADTVTVTAVTPNSIPEADAGEYREVVTGIKVSLDGSNSMDPEGDTLTYTWHLLSKPDTSQSVLDDSTLVNPSFTPDIDGDYVYELVVNDGNANSEPDYVIIYSYTPNTVPIANAGPDQNVNTGATVTLDGSKSLDYDIHDTLTYDWIVKSEPAGSTVVLHNPTTKNPTFTAVKEGVYVLGLMVSDGEADSIEDTISVITKIPNTKPVATTEADKTIEVNKSAEISGTGTDSDGSIVSYQWTKSGTLLSNSPTFQYTPDTIGEDTLVLTVTDNDGATASDNIVLTVTDAPTEYIIHSDHFSGVVNNIVDADKTRIILGSDKYLVDVVPSGGGSYGFSDIPDGEYFLKVQVAGQKSEKTKRVVIDTKAKQSRSAAVNVSLDFDLTPLDPDHFSFHWEDDNASRSGYEYSAYVNQPPKIKFLDEELEHLDIAVSEELRNTYHIILSDEDQVWNEENAYRLLETMKSIPQDKKEGYQGSRPKISKWVLKNSHIADDITVVKDNEGDTITISTDAFVYANPKIVSIDGVKGKFFSQRLHHALVNYVTDYGNDAYAVQRILSERFGCTTSVPSYVDLTAPTTGEDDNSFQDFHPDELVTIINMFEEMPEGYHVVKGLKYLVRRKDGMPHPLYDAPAVSWPTAHAESYIEFMDTAFISDLASTQRLILHEKSHFMWANLFSDEIKNDWIKVGGWYENPDDPDGWSTTKQTEFVSAYAHKKNPNEDMAESVAYFVLQPEKLKSRSIGKYEFVRDRIMHGNFYISKIPDYLTFEVLNLFPDYIYPGKIKRVDIHVDGAEDEDKFVTVEIELHTLDKIFDGASYATGRVYSEIGTFEEIQMYPVNEEGTILRTMYPIKFSKYAKNGFWFVDQITITDKVGNQRFEGIDDFGWKLYLNNPHEDLIEPKYVPGSLKLSLEDAVMEGHDLQILNVSFEVDENEKMKDNQGVYAHIINPSSGAYRHEKNGEYDETTKRASIDFYITEFFASGIYNVPYIRMDDAALNTSSQYFSDSPDHEPLVTIDINTTNPDLNPPEVDLNRITIHAEPTNSEAPNGETKVKITYYAKDDKSGLGAVHYILLDPQGVSHYEGHYHENFHTLYFEGNPTEWKEYEINITLPVGSAPGIWGLQQIEVLDKARNKKAYNFTEHIHFEVLD